MPSRFSVCPVINVALQLLQKDISNTLYVSSSFAKGVGLYVSILFINNFSLGFNVI